MQNPRHSTRHVNPENKQFMCVYVFYYLWLECVFNINSRNSDVVIMSGKVFCRSLISLLHSVIRIHVSVVTMAITKTMSDTLIRLLFMFQFPSAFRCLCLLAWLPISIIILPCPHMVKSCHQCYWLNHQTLGFPC